MVTSNVLQRTLKIRRRRSAGTAFTLDRRGRQYLVTARHILEGMAPGESLGVWYEERWRALDVRVAGIGEGEADVAVLAASMQLSPMHRLEASHEGLCHGQSVYFLGFPYGYDSGGGEINSGLPIPFAKSGIVSALGSGVIGRIYIDAHANEGFSGGPVVCHPSSDPVEPDELRIAGVVTGSIHHTRTVTDHSGNQLATVGESGGIVVAVGIEKVVSLIDANPIGFKLPRVG